VAARLAHDHAIEATEVSGRVDYDPATPEATTVTIEAKTASLRVDDPDVRKTLSLVGDPSAKDRAEIEKAMRSSGQLDSNRFPAIRFASSRVVRQQDGRLLVTGVLTLRGVSREVALPVEVREQGGAYRGRGTVTFRPSLFGIPPYSALLGAIRNKDEVVLHVELWTAP
jgi:polyisoprenoid-binding protein YceI